VEIEGEYRCLTENANDLTDSLCVEESGGVGQLAEIRTNEVNRKTVGVGLDEVEEVARCTLCAVGMGIGQNQIVEVGVFPKLDEMTDVWMTHDRLVWAAWRGFYAGYEDALWVPRPAWVGQGVGRVGDGAHYVDLNGDRAEARMLLPAVGEDAGLDNLLKDDWLAKGSVWQELACPLDYTVRAASGLAVDLELVYAAAVGRGAGCNSGRSRRSNADNAKT